MGPQISGKETLGYCIKALSPFWGGLTCDAVKGSTCRAYERERAKPLVVEYVGRKGGRWKRTLQAGPSKVRRELGALQAGLNYAHAEGVLLYAPTVTLTEESPPREAWLTRDQAAKLLRHSSPHLRRLILISVRTGTRSDAVLRLRTGPSLTSGCADLERGILHRKCAGERESNKRRGSVALPRGLLAHMRRWTRMGSHFVMWGGKPLAEIDTALAAACRRAGLEGFRGVHDLKRTAVTWAFQGGMTREDAADYFDTSVETLGRIYKVHSPLH